MILRFTGWHIFDEPPLHAGSVVVGDDPLGDDNDLTYVQVVFEEGVTDAAIGTCENLAPGGPLPYDVVFHVRASASATFETTTTPVGIYILGAGAITALIDVAESAGINDYSYSLRDYAIANFITPDLAMDAARACLEATSTDYAGFQPQESDVTMTVYEMWLEVIYSVPDSSIDGSLKSSYARFGRRSVV